MRFDFTLFIGVLAGVLAALRPMLEIVNSTTSAPLMLCRVPDIQPPSAT